jgi:DNA-binding CsgD family transcriptional regulator
MSGGIEADDDWTTRSEPIRTPRLRRDVAGLHERLVAALRPTDEPPVFVDDVATAIETLDACATELTASLRTGSADLRRRGVTRDAAVDLLLDVAELRPRLAREQDEVRSRAFTTVREAVGMLKAVSSVEQLVRRAPMAVARLGPDRAFVSSIEEAHWVPRACFVRGDPEWASAIVQAGREQPRRLDRRLLETEMVRRRQPIRVRDAQRMEGVHPEIAAVSMSRSYVAAPIVVRDSVIGFLHADYYEQRRLVGEIDATVLWMFADAVGLEFERVAYGEQLAALRTSMFDGFAAAERRFEGITGGRPALWRDQDPAPEHAPSAPQRSRVPWPVAAPRRSSAIEGLLTPRELEVLRVMADGATNEGIATRLVISHGTAKTHVKHILRKLEASNRAEAVSRWFQLERGGDGADA